MTPWRIVALCAMEAQRHFRVRVLLHVNLQAPLGKWRENWNMRLEACGKVQKWSNVINKSSSHFTLCTRRCTSINMNTIERVARDVCAAACAAVCADAYSAACLWHSMPQATAHRTRVHWCYKLNVYNRTTYLHEVRVHKWNGWEFY